MRKRQDGQHTMLAFVKMTSLSKIWVELALCSGNFHSNETCFSYGTGMAVRDAKYLKSISL